jgi:hypothetical protein
MNAADVLRAARAAGVQISVDGNDLLLEARLPPPPALFDNLLHYKTGALPHKAVPVSKLESGAHLPASELAEAERKLG